jgi:hypothetical protein
MHLLPAIAIASVVAAVLAWQGRHGAAMHHRCDCDCDCDLGCDLGCDLDFGIGIGIGVSICIDCGCGYELLLQMLRCECRRDGHRCCNRERHVTSPPCGRHRCRNGTSAAIGMAIV